MSLVKPRKNPFTGAVVVADVVVRSGMTGDPALTERDHRARPWDVGGPQGSGHDRIVPSLNVGAAGKLARLGASAVGA